jgi:hypothetical protein
MSSFSEYRIRVPPRVDGSAIGQKKALLHFDFDKIIVRYLGV